MFAGCWDKDIWSWDKESEVPGRKYKGHADFVKAILCTTIGGKNVGHRFQNLKASLLIIVVPHIRWCRCKDHSLGHGNGRATTYSPRQDRNHDGNTRLRSRSRRKYWEGGYVGVLEQ